MNTTVRKLVAATGLAFAASFAQAAPLQSTFDFLVDVKWVDATFTPGIASSFGGITNGSNVVEWGAGGSYPYVDYHRVNADSEFARSALEISNSPVGGSLYTNSGDSNNVNLFKHYNSEMRGDFQSLTSATLQVNVKLALPNGTIVETVSKDFKVYFIETPNNGGTCAWGSCNNDIFAVVSDLGFQSTFSYGGNDYTLNYFEPSNVINPLSNVACQQAGIAAGTSCYGFTTMEKNITTAQFALSVTGTVPSIPEPETYAMLLAGLGIIGVVARRRTAK